ncbi:MAG: hypothetical protein FWD11_03190 [Micrococcales bacterium]|nr:hypothetical protein [Micrococcales bacterium]
MNTTRTMTALVGAVLLAATVAGCQNDSTPPVPPTPADTQPSAPAVDAPDTTFPPQVRSQVTELSGDLVGIWVPTSGSEDFSQVVCQLSTGETFGNGSWVRCDLVDESAAYTDINTSHGSDPCGAEGPFKIGYLEIVDGTAGFNCPSDTVLGDHDVPVATGETVQLGDIQCTATTTGFACLDLTTGAAVLATLDEWNIYNR